MAWARAGAQVTGVDFSIVAIDAAEELAHRAGLDQWATFVQANVYDAVGALGGATFDIVYVSLGALSWLPSVARWAGVVGALLAPGGRLYLHDVHPLGYALSDDDLSIAYSYFEEAEPDIFDDSETYTDQERPLEHTRSYEWNHSLGEVVGALIAQGLEITQLTEHDWTVWQRWPWLVPVRDPGSDRPTWANPPGLPRVPLTFTLLARRP